MVLPRVGDKERAVRIRVWVAHHNSVSKNLVLDNELDKKMDPD